LLSPAAAVERHGAEVTLDLSNPHGVLVRQKHATLAPSPDGDWYQDVIEIDGRQHGASARLTAQCGSGPLRAETTIAVRADHSGPPAPEIKLAALNSFVPGTFETHEDTGKVTITVNATHPAVRRYFGPHPDFPLQESIEARMMVAETAADLTVLDVLRRHLHQQPIPVRADVSPALPDAEGLAAALSRIPAERCRPVDARRLAAEGRPAASQVPGRGVRGERSPRR
jgi:hypothetical protein